MKLHDPLEGSDLSLCFEGYSTNPNERHEPAEADDPIHHAFRIARSYCEKIDHGNENGCSHYADHRRDRSEPYHFFFVPLVVTRPQAPQSSQIIGSDAARDP